MLVEAAAAQWGVDPATCSAAKSVIKHTTSGRTLGYGELAAAAAARPVPEHPRLKEPNQFTLIGTRVKRVDTPAKVTGAATFGMDVNLPGMLVAVVARPPAFGSTVQKFDATTALAIPGVRRVVPVTNGVAVVATGYWAATKGRRALTVTFTGVPNERLSSAGIARAMREAANGPGAVVRQEGAGAGGLTQAVKRVDAEYEVPFLAHATMEPMNCVADVRADRCEIWAPTQRQDQARATAAEITGLPPAAVTVHTTFLGGGFGRRFETDFITDAVEASKRVGAPVKVIFSREDDIQHDFYRTAAYCKLAGGLDVDGWPIAWTNTIVSASTFKRVFPAMIKNNVDDDCVEGAANLPYDVPNIHVAFVMQDLGVPVGFWRSVGNSQNAYVTECFLDELAAAGGKDPVDLRRRLLAKKPRHLGVLNLAAERAGWGTPLPKGRFRGVAVHQAFDSYVAEVAEISLNKGAVRVHRVVAAVDCGRVVNPSIVEAQIEGGIVYGLTAALKGEITIEHGRVKQSNFHDYSMLRMSEMPAVEVHIVPSTEAPTGVGEPGTPPIAPAVANAIRAATGAPVRSLPIKLASVLQAGTPR
jgi:isoquinoline 1-oxidoreductase beta subunit